MIGARKIDTVNIKEPVFQKNTKCMVFYQYIQPFNNASVQKLP